ncbi:uncharacterized protein HHUB_4333 (plasmid) [Halobacterium hubeiense]|uniref:Uncharacterized protein n=1 Tax=Halobacterium hubeiense TaxID=1407499 RepID=A0A0U5D1Z2_9EURY|nr:hypothetical protein [Halobacterium hubeiense]CQH64244.1 uncharacterized protein HHUB_4333 [Halobacterium hubeiense]
MSDNPANSVSRRSVLRTTGLSIASLPLIGAFTDEAAAADDLPYDKINNKENSTTIRYTKNALWHNYIKIGVSSTLQHFGSDWTDGDERWNHKFGINTQAVAYHTQDEKLRPNIKSQSTKAKKIGDSSLILSGQPIGSPYVGATPSNNSEDLEQIFTTALEATAGLLSAKFAVASAATSIANSLKEAGSRTCKEASDCEQYEWTYLQDKKEVSHQAKWWATTEKDEWGNFEVATQADSETAISFVVAVGPDYGDVAPGDPPSRTGAQDVKSAEEHPYYMTRDELDDLSGSDRLPNSGIPSPQSMDGTTADKFGVQKLDSPKIITVDGEEKEVTHVAKNMPTQIFGLEPKNESE